MRYILSSLLVLGVFSITSACKGCISLDEHNFDKVISKFKAVLVKFDIAYPYGEKHEVYTKFAEEIIPVRDFIMAEVGVKDYGDKENEELAKKHGVEGKDDLPSVKLYLGSATKSVNFTEQDFTINNLRNFVRDNTDMYIGLPGCIEEFDNLAVDFLTSQDKEKKLKDVEELAGKRPEEEQPIIKTYLTFMKKVMENGLKFIMQEKSRLNKILKDGKLGEKKKDELSQRLNILHSFRIQKDEL